MMNQPITCSATITREHPAEPGPLGPAEALLDPRPIRAAIPPDRTCVWVLTAIPPYRSCDAIRCDRFAARLGLDWSRARRRPTCRPRHRNIPVATVSHMYFPSNRVPTGDQPTTAGRPRGYAAIAHSKELTRRGCGNPTRRRPRPRLRALRPTAPSGCLLPSASSAHRAPGSPTRESRSSRFCRPPTRICPPTTSRTQSTGCSPEYTARPCTARSSRS